MSWTTANWRGLLIVAYFVVGTVWLPDRILRLDTVAQASANMRDALVLVVWGSLLVAGMWLLRVGQRRGLI